MADQVPMDAAHLLPLGQRLLHAVLTDVENVRSDGGIDMRWCDPFGDRDQTNITGRAPGPLGCNTDATAHRGDSVRHVVMALAHRLALRLLTEVERPLSAFFTRWAPLPTLVCPRRRVCEHVFERGAHLFGILERTVHGGEAHICDLVE